MKTFFSILLLFTFLNTNAQDKKYKSLSYIITKANGIESSVKVTKTYYFEIMKTQCINNDCGTFFVSDGPLHTGQQTNYEKFRIYTVELKDDGKYYYWTIDIGNDGQTILFIVDNNSAIATITMHRYAPGNESVILKSTVYYID